MPARHGIVDASEHLDLLILTLESAIMYIPWSSHIHHVLGVAVPVQSGQCSFASTCTVGLANLCGDPIPYTTDLV